jgi:hypothetical protein
MDLFNVATSAHSPNHKGGEKDGTKKCRETKGQENVALNKAYQDYREP